MLDSTAPSSFPQIPCVFCPKTVTIEICSPKFGHAGEDISMLPPYLGSPIVGRYSEDRKLFHQGKLFSLINTPPKCQINSVTLNLHRSPYAYGNLQAPNFGLGNDKVFWVCKECWALAGSEEEVLEALRAKDGMWYQFYEEQGRIVHELARA